MRENTSTIANTSMSTSIPFINSCSLKSLVYQIMLKLSFADFPLDECGVDEAGAGPLCGPVVAAAVVWSKEQREGIRDSKKLSESKRTTLSARIKSECDDYAITYVSHEVIDEINVLEARLKAMRDAIALLCKPPKLILVDGNRFHPYRTKDGDEIAHELVVRGDDEYTSIAAASILAKVERDAHMLELHREYPMYGWDRNKGYGTKEHEAAIRKYGLTPYHRKSFVKKFL